MNAVIGFTTLAVSNIDDKKRVRDYLDKINSDLSGRFSYELICCITKRVPRIYL